MTVLVELERLMQGHDIEYNRLKKFLLFFFHRYLSFVDMPEYENPIVKLENLEKEKGLASAKSGLRQALVDCIEMTGRMNADEVSRLDRELLELDIPTLSELRIKYSRVFSKILKKNRIDSADEYYLVSGIANVPKEVSGIEVNNKATELMAAYELRAQ